MGILTIFLIFSITIFQSSRAEDIPACSSNIYCYGPLLDAAQSAGIYDDSKSFVDMKLLENPDIIYAKFEELLASSNNNPSDEDVKDFVNDNFDPPGSEFVDWIPDDWKESPSFINRIEDNQLRTWASTLNELWKELGRKIIDDASENSQLYSIISVPNAMVVPGGRFREYYYWDTYWVMRGLLLSEMFTTAKDILENLLYLVDIYGFIPNGGRVYYTERSQPPFLIPMVYDYIQATGDVDFLRSKIEVLTEEYTFWTNHRQVTIQGYSLNQYATEMNLYRPESYREDKSFSEKLQDRDPKEWMTNVASACESGWDFSSRWSKYEPSSDNLYDSVLIGINTKDVIPVDLNSILAKNAKTLMEFYNTLGEDEKSQEFKQLYDVRVEAIENLLWNGTDGTYYDYIISNNQHNRKYFASNVNPLWTKVYPSNVEESVRDQQLFDYLNNSGVLSYPGGIPTSLTASNHQWDFPNAWPPLVHMIIEGLATSNVEALQNEGFIQAQKWINSNYKAYKETDAMFEKFDVRYSDGVAGGGGEYDVQKGFGWTNGVVMSLLDRYNTDLVVNSGATSWKMSKQYLQKLSTGYILYAIAFLLYLMA